MSQPHEAARRRLVELPQIVPETITWPELERALGRELVVLTPQDRQWLTVAALHKSSLYENSANFPGVSAACLALLQSAGKAAVDVEMRRAIAKATPNSGVSTRDQTANRVGRTVRQLLADALDITSRAELGIGEASTVRERMETGAAGRTFEDVAMQVAGWWSLVMYGHRLREFIDELCIRADALTKTAIGLVDVRSTFQKHFHMLNPQFKIKSSGPDNARIFIATVGTDDGRIGRAEARSKKHAQQLACQDYLSSNAPHLLVEAESSRSVPAAARRHFVSLTDERYVVLAAAFGCSESRPFARALIHRSWVYENMPDGDTERDSNARLANLGSYVLIATLMRWRAALHLSRTTDPDPELSVPVSLPDAALRQLFDALGLQRLARVGTGLRYKPYADEMVADMMQATLAASHTQWPDHESFEESLPVPVKQFLTAQASISLIDPATRLQELAAEFGLRLNETNSQTGLRHNTTYHVRLNIHGLLKPVAVDGQGRSLREARKAASAKFLSSASILSDDSQKVMVPAVARLLLLRQMKVLATSRSRWPRWHHIGRLAIHMLLREDLESFGRWAAHVEEVIGAEWRPDTATESAIADYYRLASHSSRGRPSFTETLTKVTDWVTGAVGQEDAITSWDFPVRQLIALAAAQSVWMSTGESIAVDRIIDDWMLLNRRRFHVERQVFTNGVTVDPRTAAALLRGLQECTTELSGLKATRIILTGGSTPDGCTLIVESPDYSLAQLNGSILMQLLCEATPRLSIRSPDHHGIQLNLQVSARPVRGAWLIRAAFSEHMVDDYDAELARLIHDLKNEVTAAQVASKRSAANRTERLEAELTSSRHMDAAAALASRLRDADMLYAAADLFGSTDLATFMQAYISDLIRRLPANIRVLPPTLTPAVVALDERALRAVIDNLVKNAEQAMMNGGDITIDYTALLGEDMVLLEFTDSGRGIPKEVIEAFVAGRPIASSKREGSGLGLHGVRRVVRRAGGDLEPMQRSCGTGWLITLPLTPVSDSVGPLSE